MSSPRLGVLITLQVSVVHTRTAVFSALENRVLQFCATEGGGGRNTEPGGSV